MAAAGGAAHGFTGVSQQKNGKWRAQKSLKGTKLTNGQAHPTAEDAAHAYDW